MDANLCDATLALKLYSSDPMVIGAPEDGDYEIPVDGEEETLENRTLRLRFENFHKASLRVSKLYREELAVPVTTPTQSHSIRERRELLGHDYVLQTPCPKVNLIGRRELEEIYTKDESGHYANNAFFTRLRQQRQMS